MIFTLGSFKIWFSLFLLQMCHKLENQRKKEDPYELNALNASHKSRKAMLDSSFVLWEHSEIQRHAIWSLCVRFDECGCILDGVKNFGHGPMGKGQGNSRSRKKYMRQYPGNADLKFWKLHFETQRNTVLKKKRNMFFQGQEMHALAS